MKPTCTLFLAALVFAAVHVRAADDDDAVDARAIAAAVADSIVTVQYEFRYDKGDPPQGTGWGMYWTPTQTRYPDNLLDYIRDERSADKAGFALSSNTIITSDPVVNSRFIKSITVRKGDQVVPATRASIGRDESVMTLRLDEPLRGVTPLTFDAGAEGPFYTVTRAQHDGQWMTSVKPLAEATTVDADGALLRSAPRESLIVNVDGAPVGMSFNGELAGGDAWRGSPQHWPMLDEAQVEDAMADLAAAADATVLRIALSFRSPKKSDEAAAMRGRYYGDEETETERNVAGVMIDAQRVLVLAVLKPAVTARLERIRVFGPGNEEIPATFVGSLRDYGGFVIETERPLSGSGAHGLSRNDIAAYTHTFLPEARVLIQGESRVPYYQHERFATMKRGWKNHMYPEDSPEVDEFVFDDEGRLLAVPIARRLKPALEDMWGEGEPVLTASMYLAEVFDNLESHLDETNVPLSEEEENRIAWLGVELQALDRQLARASDVADLTNDGQSGAIVTYVYAGSPAEQAGLQMGDILLRIHVTDHPKPIDISADVDYFGGAFPWDQLDNIPEDAFDRVPAPWPGAQNSLNTTLTRIGFGTPYELEYVRDGDLHRRTLEVSESPPYFVAARKFESETLGVTVKDLTYEVRRYLQRDPDEPGVIVSRIEPGSKISTAGLKTYELITHVNDQPVDSAAAFGELIEGETDIKLSVKRMARGRIVKVELE